MFNFDQRRAGILLHITSLPGPHGIGDLGPDAYRFVDWLESAGQQVWQLLPTTPIGPGNSPYQSVSAFAGSPLMVALEPLVSAGWLEAPQLPEGGFDAAGVDYARVASWRLAQLRLAASGFLSTASGAEHERFAAWHAQQAHWLDDYALFMALEKSQQDLPWWLWEAGLRERKPAVLQQVREQQAEEISVWKFIQWCFDSQMKALKDYANRHHVALMGDLPIFMAHHSTDCWMRPDLYALDATLQPTVVAGAPPDDLGPLGQRWGNPLYRWERMAEENFAWWTARVRRALEHADLFRVDHFRGFASYWEIPASCPSAVEGHWVAAPGKALFKTIELALGRLPIIAEDLGFITPDVIELRDACAFPGMKVLQFAFGSDASHPYLPHNFARNCVVYTGTHDNDTVRGWWNNTTESQRRFASSYLGAGPDDVHWAMIHAACNSVANMAVFPLQDVLGLDSHHRMNRPGTLGGSNWAWRFDWNMLGCEPARVLGHMTAASGRGPFELSHRPEAG